MKLGVFSWLLFFCLFAFGQEQHLDTLFILAKKQTTSKISSISAKEIQQLQANDVGEVLQKIPGMTVKNYGGIGGMKTVSVRGLGSAHQQIVVDGFLVPNTQTGMVDLGNIYATNVEYVALLSGSFTEKLIPVSAVLGANTLYVDRKEAQFSTKKHSIQSKISYGSFNTLEAWLSYKAKLTAKQAITGSGSFRTSEGNYPYQFQNYTQKYTGRRVNADLLEGTANAVYQFQINDKVKLLAEYSFFQSDKGLPGAVILYLNVAQQRLKTISHQGNMSVKMDFSKWKGKFYSTYKNEQITYLDNGFLNIQGYQKSFYHQQQLITGWVMRHQISKLFLHEIGVEGFFAKLQGDISTEIQPQRIQGKAYYGFGSMFSWGIIKAQLAGQTLSDYNQRKQIGKTSYYWQPSFVFKTTKNFPIIGDIQFFYKRNVRVAGFNELYYNQIGNKELKPEMADQFQVSFTKNKTVNKSNFQYGANVYYNQEQNKIVAIPTKNLFVWMIQNVDKVAVAGMDMQFYYIQYLGEKKDWNLSVNANYTFQSVTNRTDKTSQIYGNQLAYFPKHIANLDVVANWKGVAFGVNTYFVGKRYALNENNKANEVNKYMTIDVYASYKWHVKETHALTFRAMCKNIGNVSYAYVKYYVLPGINYLMSINYEF